MNIYCNDICTEQSQLHVSNIHNLVIKRGAIDDDDFRHLEKKVLVIILVKDVTSCLTKWVTTSTTNGLASRLLCMFAECSGA